MPAEQKGSKAGLKTSKFQLEEALKKLSSAQGAADFVVKKKVIPRLAKMIKLNLLPTNNATAIIEALKDPKFKRAAQTIQKSSYSGPLGFLKLWKDTICYAGGN